jgi:hypothetical protein
MGPTSQTDIVLLSNSQSLALPKLDPDGSNWVLYKTQIVSVLIYQRVIHYVNGHAQKPQTPGSRANSDVIEKYETDLKIWEIENEHAQSIVLSTLPKIYQIEVVRLETAKQTWEPICSKFNNQSEIVQIDLLHQMNQT